MAEKNVSEEQWIADVVESDEIQVSQYDITATPNDFNVMTISNFIDQGSIVLPVFQRNFTWDLKRASKLIESLILGLPVPQTFLYEDKRDEFLILDGQQRLMSIYFFIKKRFPKLEKRTDLRLIFMEYGTIPQKYLSDDKYFVPFNLKLLSRPDGNDNIFNDLNYDTLGDHQKSFQLRPIRNVIVKQNEPKNDNSSIYEMFDRLNTGGVILKSQEIRANLYYSGFYRALYELNRHSGWRRIIMEPQEDLYMRDVELLLRSFAMLLSFQSYKPSMTRFLNEFSHKAKQEYNDDFIDKIKVVFENFILSLSQLPEDTFFRQTSKRFSIALFEAIFVAKCLPALDDEDYSITKLEISDIESVSNNPKFVSMLQEGTTKQTHVKGRIKLAIEKIGIP